jgi:hypothetical protein
MPQQTTAANTNPDKIHTSEAIKLALVWTEKYFGKAAAAFAVASAKYVRPKRRLVASDVAGDAKKALPADSRTAIQLKLRECSHCGTRGSLVWTMIRSTIIRSSGS